MDRLSRIKLRGFKSIREIDLPLGDLNVLIGANGAGKSNLLSFLRMLSELAHGRATRFFAEEGGANVLLHYGRKRTRDIDATVTFEDEHGSLEYGATFRPGAPDTFFVDREEVRAQDVAGVTRVLALDQARAIAFSLLQSSVDAELEGRFSSFLRLLTHYHFHDTSRESPIRHDAQIEDNRSLHETGRNLASFLYMLKQRYVAAYESICDTVQLAAPFFDAFVLEPSALNPNMVSLEWRERGSDTPFFAHHLSDGTLRFIALTTALLQPHPPPLVAFDEPELGLHPYAMTLLASMLRAASTRQQVIVATQSVTLLDALAEPDEVVVVERRLDPGHETSASVFRRLDAGALATWYEDYTLGELWQKNVLGGRP
jgi:predicted ATPase